MSLLCFHAPHTFVEIPRTLADCGVESDILPQVQGKVDVIEVALQLGTRREALIESPGLPNFWDIELIEWRF